MHTYDVCTKYSSTHTPTQSIVVDRVCGLPHALLDCVVIDNTIYDILFICIAEDEQLDTLKCVQTNTFFFCFAKPSHPLPNT
uniref:Uncharacterized protein n=1 Tax=Glossina palpalis gambiensis TaxID=67801 RepID=A0A1B0AT21_9MUSC